MKIGIVTPHCFPSPREVRISKLTESLMQRGHECVVFCPGGASDAGMENFQCGRIIRRIPSFPGLLGRLANAVAPINPGWAIWLARQFRNRRIDVVIVRDLRLTLPATYAAHKSGIKIVLDIAEHYPGMMKIVRKPGLLKRIYRSPRLISWLEALSVKKADSVWVVCEENGNRLLKYNARINVVNNYPPAEAVSSVPECRHRPYASSGEPVRVISFGLINEIRGLDLAVDAFAILERQLPNIRLVIYGDGPNRQSLIQQTSALGLSDKVEFPGHVDFERRYHAISSGDIGIILHSVCDLTQHTLPNKLFDYMAVGLPVVSTSLAPVARILSAENCGIAVEEDPEEVARGIRKLIEDRKLRTEMGGCGRRAVYERYLWDNEAPKVERYLESLIA